MVEDLSSPETGGLHPSHKAALEAEKYLQSRLSSTTSAPSFRSIPVIDLTLSYSSSVSERQAIAEKINEACTSVGFFFLTGHGIPDGVCNDVLHLAKRFFHELPQESREAIHVNAYFRGYEPAAFSSANDLESKETKEAFNWGYESGLDPTGGDGKYVELDGTPESAVNLWPSEEEIPGFYEGIATHLFRLFARSLALPEDYFDPMMTHPGGIARLIRYPPRANPKPLSDLHEDAEIGLGAHSDYECFTLLLQDSTPGLEVLRPDGRWVRVEPVAGAIVVNVADFLMRWTNGLYKSTVHRVVNRTDRERYSIPLFFSINYDETVATLPSCVSEENPSKYPPITAGKYVLDRLSLTVKTGKD
ncbi:flavonol synthase/flavanone 3-hydroxylase [Diplocarpon rosae]|nr:flavonol synthase/flavanone 3-hydroxylase [Diplocarpon rosae]